MNRTHHDLLVWQEAIYLVKEVYKITSHFPSHEIYSLTSQTRRAAISVVSNIAEGAARNGKREFFQFLSIARGSLSELETQIILAYELNYLNEDKELMTKIERIFGLLTGLMKSLKRTLNT